MSEWLWQWSVNVPLTRSTWCHHCDGKGATLMPRMGVADGEPIPTAQMQECRTCGGTGRLPGVQVPA
ncbi:hypothetical protein SAMN05443637_11913 [Pseudonocardia thermophila]|jgi:hypothetical protein|uniref:DnaJ central domain-containing protein n=1 Tax=Pseudonocardia thermophila TaxID=1848 RepID=A0A1M6Y7B0_PSETH|nr:hypothetical protein [Pseudonocardia thermophila]SHL13919.1 hypothetical protein SAMN05443637_11913 [Pseudonocardia thermophila]